MMAGSQQEHAPRPRWTPKEKQKLLSYMEGRDPGSVRWSDVPDAAGLNRTSKSCWLKWNKYLRPGIKRGHFSQDEVKFIINFRARYGNKWAKMAEVLYPRTDNEIKNYYNVHLKKKLSKNDTPSSSQTPLHEIGLTSTDPAEDLPSQTRGFNYEAMKNPTVYNKGSTPAVMVSVENVLTPPPEVSVCSDDWIDKLFPEDQTGETSESFGGDTALVQHTSIM